MLCVVAVAWLTGGVASAVAPAAAPTTRPAGFHAAETREQRDARMAWWREAKFGMFVHWGIYSVPAGQWKGKEIGGNSEWIQNMAKIPVAEYAQLAGQFNPVKFDADRWVLAAKGAGMKYLIITAKHHDGFAMFDSKASTFDIVDATPFNRDPLKELAAACARHGLKLGFYYSQGQDWHHKGGGVYGKHWDESAWGSSDEYVDKVAVPQVRELLTNYGPVAVLWWDTPAGINPARAERLDAVLALQPGIITNDRLGAGFKGDTGTPEQHVPNEVKIDRDWESCMTMNWSWGFRRSDENWKSPGSLVFNLVDVVSKGGNYLLNVGPTDEGLIPQPSLERLEAVGRWLSVNGEAIYGAGPTPFGPELGKASDTEKDKKGQPVFKQARDWRATTKPGKLYVTLFKWPGTSFTLDGVRSTVTGAHLLAGGAPVTFAQQGGSVRFTLPDAPADPLGTVLAISLSEPSPDKIGMNTQTPPTTQSTPELNLGERVRPLPASARFADPDFYVWCGAPILGDDGKYHLYYSRWPKAAKFMAWATQSEVAHAVSDSPLGPWKHVGVALPAGKPDSWDSGSIHNPYVVRHKGKYVLFYMGNKGDGDWWVHRNNQRIGVAIADKPEGPWERFGKPALDVDPDPKAWDALVVNNPAVAVRPDGKLLMVYKGVSRDGPMPKGGVVRHGVAIADDPRGPWVRQHIQVLEPKDGGSKDKWMVAEDPFIWYSERYGNKYYAIARDAIGHFTGSNGGIALFESADGLDWKPARNPKVLDGAFALEGGARSDFRLERPFLLFDETGDPIALFGATDGYETKGRLSSNVQIPLRKP